MGSNISGPSIPTTCCDVTETHVTDVGKQTAMTAMHKIVKGGINASRGVDSMLLGYYAKILVVSLRGDLVNDRLMPYVLTSFVLHST